MKLFSIAVAACLMLTLAGCSSKNDSKGGAIGASTDIKKSTTTSVGTDLKSSDTEESKMGSSVSGSLMARSVIIDVFDLLSSKQSFKYSIFKTKPEFLISDAERNAPDEALRAKFVAVLQRSLSPITGWPRDRSSQIQMSETCDVAVLFTRRVYGLLLPYVPDYASRNQTEGVKTVLKVWDQIKTERLIKIWDESLDEWETNVKPQQTRFDFSGTDVRWFQGKYTFSGNEKGLSYTVAGKPMFTEDSINGMKVDVAMDRGRTMVLSETIDSSQKTSADQSKSVTNSAGISTP